MLCDLIIQLKNFDFNSILDMVALALPKFCVQPLSRTVEALFRNLSELQIHSKCFES